MTKRLLFLFLAIALPAFGQEPTKAVKVNGSNVLEVPNATDFWTANPLTPTFITQTPSSFLTSEQALSGMSTGILGVTTGTGALNSFSDSAGLRGALSDETGTGSLVFANTPTLVTPVLGAATATSINGLGITTTTGTLAVANSKTATISNTLTFTGTDASSIAFGTGGTVGYASAGLSQFANTTSAELAGIITNETGSGALVFGTSPTLTTPNIGAATATTVNGLTISSSTGTLSVTNGKTLSAANTLNLSGTDSANINFGAGGTVGYTSGTLAQFSNTTSAQLNSIITDETGSGSLVFGTSPVLTTPNIGAAVASSLNGLTISTSTGTLSIANSKIFTVSNTIGLAGTDGATLNIGSGGVLGALAFANSIDASDGGTGISSYAVGDLLTANGTSSLTRLAAVATGNVLVSQGIATPPVYGKVGVSHSDGTLYGYQQGSATITADGQTVTVGTNSIITIGSNSSTATSRSFDLSAGTSGQVVTLVFNDTTDRIELTTTGAVNTYKLNGNWVPITAGESILLVYAGGLGWVEVSRSTINNYITADEVVCGVWDSGAGIRQTLYRKVINVGTLPNAATSTDAHGIPGGFPAPNFRRIYGYAEGASDWRPLPYSNPSALNANIGLTVDATNINITTAINYTAWSGYVVLEYTR